MEDVIQVQDQFYILATASRLTERTAVLKHDETFAVFDYAGDIGVYGSGEQGLYHEGTRYLSRFRLRLNGQRPLLLSSRVKEDNELFGADLTNPDVPFGEGDRVLSRDLVHLFRSRFLWNATWHERLRLWNYSRDVLRIVLTFDVSADFVDIFEVRGTERARHGTMLEPTVGGREIRLGYRGLDNDERWTIIEWSQPPSGASANAARFELHIAPHASTSLSVAIRCERVPGAEDQPGADRVDRQAEAHGANRKRGGARARTGPPLPYEGAEAEAASSLEHVRAEYATIDTSSERFNQWVRRSAADLRMLVSTTPWGKYPYAGVPWFSTPFGRDGIIAGLQTLWVNPHIARGVLEYLSATQADHFDEAQDAEPGKILHETRDSEMARLGEVPFGCYYGSVDATPLFVILAGAYYERTGDRAFLASLWPHVLRALEWIDRHGDRDGDGFVEYARRSATGLVQQGWKDSHDSIFHADGTLAEPPIAVCEVQAYAYDARVRAAKLASALGHDQLAGPLMAQANRLRDAFEERFWCEEESTYALALDGHKRRCRVRTSNAGHCLFGGIASPERARRTADMLVGPHMFSGWGVRTLASTESRYNPMSYHNGSVWPHDNGMIAEGFSRYGFDDLVSAPFAGLFEASATMDGHRLPELFCGFHRRHGEGPTMYPVACAPQAWASGVVFQLIQASLRLSVDAGERRLSIDRSILPPFLTYLRLLGLKLPFGEIDLLFEQHERDVSVTVLRKTGQFEIRVTK